MTRATLKNRLNQAFFLLVFASEANAWVRAAGGNNGLKAGVHASAFSSGNGDPVLFALNALVIAATVLLCFPRLRTISAVVTGQPAMLAVYGYSVLTILWSANPGNSFRTAVYLVAGLFQFVYIGLYFTADEQVSLVARAVSLFALLSVPAQFMLAPVQDLAPGWTGIFPSKNYLGNVMAIGLIALLLERSRWTLYRQAQGALCLALLLLSQSFTSVLCVVMAAAVLLYLRLRARERVLLVVCGGAAVLLGLLFVPDAPALILGASGKDTSLTGRDVIWAFAVKHIAMHPLLGYGYYAFWISEESSALQYLGWNPGQAHNGFLNLALDEGLVGVGLLLGMLFTGLRRSLAQIRRGDAAGTGRWLLVMFVYLMIHNVSEADFYQRPAWVVYLVAFVACSQVELRHRLEFHATQPRALAWDVPAVVTL